MKTRKMKKKTAKKKTGFSLTEIVMVIAVIGVLSSIAYPNFMRLKIQTNMEVVKQHMRIIGEKITEIMGQQGGAGPSRETWGAGTTEDELSLTANLSAVDLRGYTTEDWIPADEEGGYAYKACPKDNAWGSAGDRCFRLDSFGVHEMAPWQGMWQGVNTWNDFQNTKMVMNTIFNTSAPFLDKVGVFSKVVEYAALIADRARWNQDEEGCASSMGHDTRELGDPYSTIKPDMVPSTFLILSSDELKQFTQLLKESEGILGTKGISFETRIQNVQEVRENCKSGCYDLEKVINTTSNPKGIEISFHLTDPVETAEELSARLPESSILTILNKLN